MSIAIPFGKILKLSYGLGARVLALDAKIANKYGEVSFKLPFMPDQRISDRDALIKSLEAQLVNKKIIDDGIFILIIKFPDGSRGVPIKNVNNEICTITSGTHLTKYSTSGNSTIAEVTALNKLSIIEIGNCNEINNLISFTVEIREDSEVGLYGDIEYFNISNNSWTHIGKGPRTKFFTQPGDVKVRVSIDEQEIWTGVFEESDLPDNCRSVKLILFLASIAAMQTYRIGCSA